MCHVNSLYSRFDERFVSFLKQRNVTELNKQQEQKIPLRLKYNSWWVHGIFCSLSRSTIDLFNVTS